MIKGVDRDTWVTISRLAVPLSGAATAAEVMGVCVLTEILDLVFNKTYDTLLKTQMWYFLRSGVSEGVQR